MSNPAPGKWPYGKLMSKSTDGPCKSNPTTGQCNSNPLCGKLTSKSTCDHVNQDMAHVILIQFLVRVDQNQLQVQI